MKTHRTIRYSLAGGLAILALVVVPASAQAGSLLSGYGGPGEGSQAVLGSALTGGPRGGSGGSGGPGGSGPAATSSTGGGGSEAAPGSSSAETLGSEGTRRGADGANHGAGASTPTGRGNAGTAGGGAQNAGTAAGAGAARAQRLESFYPATERVPAGGQGVVLGLTGQDILFILLTAALLIAIGLVTRRLDRSTGQTDLGG